MNDFLDGKLFMNPLSFFRKIEEEAVSNRSDKHEAVIGWHQPDQITLTINNYELKDLAGPVCVQMNAHENLNMLCLYAGHSGEFKSLSEETIPLLHEQLKISAKCSKLGGYSVLITNTSEFINRVVKAIREQGYIGTAGLVDYYNPDTFSGDFSHRDALFRKRDEFSHQSEYRFVIKRDSEENIPVTLNIGSIRDIAVPYKTSDFNEGLEIKLNTA